MNIIDHKVRVKLFSIILSIHFNETKVLQFLFIGWILCF